MTEIVSTVINLESDPLPINNGTCTQTPKGASWWPGTRKDNISRFVFSTVPADGLTLFMMTSSNGNIFRVTDHLCGEFTGRRWIIRTRASDAELWYFLCCLFFDLRRHLAHYDVTVMYVLRASAGTVMTKSGPRVYTTHFRFHREYQISGFGEDADVSSG